MKERLQNSTSYPTCFLMVSSTDHVTPVTGLSPTVVISKNGGAFAPPSGAVSEIGNGWYTLAGNATDRDTLGELLIHATGTGADPVDDRYMITAYDPFDSVRLGLTALPNAAANAAGGLPISDAGALDLDTQLATLTNGTYGLSAIETLVDDLESRLTATRAGYLDNLSAAPPTASDIATAVWGAGTRTLSSFGTLVADVATAVWGAVARTITGGTITTNSDKTGYALTGTDLADIKAKTDQLTFTTPGSVDATATVDTSDLATSANQTTIINHLTDVKGATFSGSTDSLEAIRNRGDVAWITGGTGGGSNAVTINVKDDSTVNVVDCYVEVWDSAGTSFISRTNTNSSGNVTFNLDSNTYTVKMHKTGYYFANQTLTVDGVESVAYTGTILVPSAPADPEMCRVYGFFLNPDGTIITGLTGNALVTCYQEGNTVYAGTEAGTYVTTGTYAGMMYFDIARGATATVTLEAISYSKTFTVPELDTEEFKDL
jgi:hypothetical protein